MDTLTNILRSTGITFFRIVYLFVFKIESLFIEFLFVFLFVFKSFLFCLFVSEKLKIFVYEFKGILYRTLISLDINVNLFII